MSVDKNGKNGSAEDAKLTTIKEGAATIAFEGAANCFYNPIQEFNRDLTVTVLRQFVEDRMAEREERAQQKEPSEGEEPPVKKKKKFQIEEEDGSIRILDALSASGLRALRFAQEVPHVKSVLANDFSENAVDTIRCNIEINGVSDRVTANFGDAVMTMMAHRGIDKRFHAVDLDPYGSASVFLDSAVQCVADRGILMVTCTDMAVLCGNTPEACFMKYDAIPLRIKSCHEMGLRILLRAINSHANRYSRYIEPLLSISVDFYVRIFVRVHTGAREAKDAATKTARLLLCTGCHSFETVPVLRKTVDGASLRYQAPLVKAALVGSEQKCVHCKHTLHEGGPMYAAAIHDRAFVARLLKRLQDTPEDLRLGTHRRLLGVLSLVHEELDTPLYYLHDQLSNVVKTTVPKMLAVRSAILNAGFQVSGSHCHPRAVKTTAPPDFLWDMCRTMASESNVVPTRFEDGTPGRIILEGTSKHKVDFKQHPEAMQQQKSDQYVRFQCNKGKNWGPKAKAKGSVNSVQAGFQVVEAVMKSEKKKAEVENQG